MINNWIAINLKQTDFLTRSLSHCPSMINSKAQLWDSNRATGSSAESFMVLERREILPAKCKMSSRAHTMHCWLMRPNYQALDPSPLSLVNICCAPHNPDRGKNSKCWWNLWNLTLGMHVQIVHMLKIERLITFCLRKVP